MMRKLKQNSKRKLSHAMATLVLYSSASWLLPALAQDQGSKADGSVAKPGYWSDSWRGWHFYEEPEPAIEAIPPGKKETTPVPPVPAPASAMPLQAPELAEFEHLQKILEQYRNIAIIKPSEANVRRYMELEARVVAQASYFADVAQRVAWTTPELDPTLQGRPVNAKAIDVFEQEQLSKRSHEMAELGRDHVLFFFFRSDCPYCHAFAPTLEAFQQRHGIQVVGISIDGGPMPGFPDARTDNGIARTLNVTQVPAVFLAQPQAGKITPIGFGVLSESQLLERISSAATPSSAAMVPSANRHAILRQEHTSDK